MKIILTSDSSIRLVPDPGPMTVEAKSVEQQYSPFHMLGSSLAFCTFSVMQSWATHVKIPVDDLKLDVSWEFAQDPQRVSRLDMTFDWPSLPEKRRNAARRAAELCTIHATLHHPPVVTVRAADEAPDTATAATTTTTPAQANPMTASKDQRDRAQEQHSHEHSHEHSHADGTSHSHPHTHDGEHAHEHEHRDALTARDVEIRHGSDEGNGAADLPPRPTQQGDGQEAGTSRPRRPSNEAR